VFGTSMGFVPSRSTRRTGRRSGRQARLIRHPGREPIHGRPPRPAHADGRGWSSGFGGESCGNARTPDRRTTFGPARRCGELPQHRQRTRNVWLTACHNKAHPDTARPDPIGGIVELSPGGTEWQRRAGGGVWGFYTLRSGAGRLYMPRTGNPGCGARPYRCSEKTPKAATRASRTKQSWVDGRIFGRQARGTGEAVWVYQMGTGHGPSGTRRHQRRNMSRTGRAFDGARHRKCSSTSTATGSTMCSDRSDARCCVPNKFYFHDELAERSTLKTGSRSR